MSTASAEPRAAIDSHEFGRAVRLRRVFGQIASASGWLATVSLLFIALLRVFYHDGHYVLTCVNAFTRYVYLPAYFYLFFAIWRHQWGLATFNVPLIACHLIWVMPDFVHDNRFDVPVDTPAGERETPEVIRILFANVYGNNADPGRFMEEVAEFDPDIILFAEYYFRWHNALAPLPMMKAYPYGHGKDMRFVGQIGIFSKRQIKNARRIWSTGRLSYEFDVDVGGELLRVFCLHAPRPMDLPSHDYSGYWNDLTPLLLELPDPAVVMGDFNATQYSRVYHTLIADELRSAHEDRGRGFATSWPNGRYPIPPIRIDHALLSPRVECVRIVEGRGLGSDHKPLVLDVRIRPRPAPISSPSLSGHGNNQMHRYRHRMQTAGLAPMKPHLVDRVLSL
jgi:endonuclease/exonuclease/phosphatase (EEP) superfamily protein YafD